MKNLILVLILLTSVHGFAHPVSFRNSVGIMGYHAPRMSHFQLNYSWDYWWATGYHHFSVRPQDEIRRANFLSTHFLLKRWNGEGYQANMYAVFGAGASDISGESKATGLGLFQFDIENRKYYFLAKYAQARTEDADTDLEQTSFRIGIAPYQGSFTDLHSWLILEYQRSHIFGGDVNKAVTPYLRLFYNNVLFEIGQSFDGAVHFNYISHF